MEIINSDPNMVICGIRILLGTQDIARTPSFVEVSQLRPYCLSIDHIFDITKAYHHVKSVVFLNLLCTL